MKAVGGRQTLSAIPAAFLFVSFTCIIFAARNTKHLILTHDDFSGATLLPEDLASFRHKRRLIGAEQQAKIDTSSSIQDGSPAFAAHSKTNRLLVGIFTTDNPTDQQRRRLIRKTYLSNYDILNQLDLANSNESKESMCSLADLVSKKGNTEELCRVVYTFVMGAWDETNTTALVDHTDVANEESPFVIDRPYQGIGEKEPDVIYLNIRENMNHGKTPTWFKYASSVLPAEELGIDLIAKVDLDTIIFPRHFMEELDSILDRSHRPAHGVYGGTREIFHEKEVLFMQGGFYFLSRDLAKRITSSSCPRDDIVHYIKTVVRAHEPKYDRAEDVELGNFIDQCWDKQQKRKARRVFLTEGTSAIHHPMFKDASRFRVKWKQSLATDLATVRFNQIKSEYDGGCPATPEMLENELKWFKDRPNMKLAKEEFSRMCAADASRI